MRRVDITFAVDRTVQKKTYFECSIAWAPVAYHGEFPSDGINVEVKSTKVVTYCHVNGSYSQRGINR